MVLFRRPMSVSLRPCATEESIAFSRRILRSVIAKAFMTEQFQKEKY